MGDVTINVSTNATQTAAGAVSVRIAVNLSIPHLFAECRFAKRIVEIEKQMTGQFVGDLWEELFHNALSVATLTIACLESHANEMYFQGEVLGGVLSPPVSDEVAKLVDRESIFRKYSLAFSIRTNRRLDIGCRPHQDIKDLIDLRDAIIHYRPEWMGESGDHKKLSDQLRSRFSSSPVFINETLFPRAWASTSFANWAIKSTVAFLDYYYKELGITCPLDPFRKQLSELSGGIV